MFEPSRSNSLILLLENSKPPIASKIEKIKISELPKTAAVFQLHESVQLANNILQQRKKTLLYQILRYPVTSK